MDDLISRQEAIDALKQHYWDSELQKAKDDPCVIDAMTDLDIRIIKALPSAQPGQRWIPCSERLPKEDGYYLVTRKNPKGHVTRVRFKNGDGLFYPMWGNGDCDILAWMPLPDAYKEDK